MAAIQSDSPHNPPKLIPLNVPSLQALGGVLGLLPVRPSTGLINLYTPDYTDR
jgi:hypothetical protein